MLRRSEKVRALQADQSVVRYPRGRHFKAFDFCLHQVHHGPTGSRLALHERRSDVERVARGLCPLPRVLCFLLIMSPIEHSPPSIAGILTSLSRPDS